MKSTHPSTQAAIRKVSELTSLEHRLQSAAHRAETAGFATRAESYTRQTAAVREERERWSLLLQNPPAPVPTPHLLTALVSVLVPLADLFVAGGAAVKRLARVVLTIGLVVCALIIGTSPPSLWSSHPSDVSPPLHWGTKIAQVELSRKTDIRALPVHPLSGRSLWPAS